MAKKNTKIKPAGYVLPSDTKELQSFAKQFKLEMMEQVIISIEYAYHHHLQLVEVFQFKNSDFVITVSEKDYLTNLDNIFDYYMKQEIYECCQRLVKLRETIKESINIDEKQKC